MWVILLENLESCILRQSGGEVLARLGIESVHAEAATQKAPSVAVRSTLLEERKKGAHLKISAYSSEVSVWFVLSISAILMTPSAV